MMVEAAQVAGFGQDRERQDGSDAWHLLKTPKVDVVLEMTRSSFLQLVAELAESDHLAEHDAETSQLLLSLQQQGSRWRTEPCGRYLRAAAVY